MQFTTKIPVSKSHRQIDYHSKIISLGSCFAVNIAEKFDYFKLCNVVNPFGILFHPLALEKFIGFAVNEKAFADDDVFFNNERWHCLNAHSALSDISKVVLLEKLNSKVRSTNSELKKATHIIITLGTAWVYKHLHSGQIVANCHKVPQQEFTKELLPVDAIFDSLHNMICLLQSVNPNVAIIFTVSPVRHLKDGFVENQWSKANLISALQQTIKAQPSTHYFPSYEIMMDELRDYRFYAQDMLHPNKTAIDYIWERFTQSWISEDALPVMEEIDGVHKALAHRPFNPESPAHKNFLNQLQARIDHLQTRHPHLHF